MTSCQNSLPYGTAVRRHGHMRVTYRIFMYKAPIFHTLFRLYSSHISKLQSLFRNIYIRHSDMCRDRYAHTPLSFHNCFHIPVR